MTWTNLRADILDLFNDTTEQLESLRYIGFDTFKESMSVQQIGDVPRLPPQQVSLQKAELTIECAECGEMFATDHSLRVHRAVVHTYAIATTRGRGGVRPGFKFNVQKKAPPRPQPYQCDECGAMYGTFNGLFAHANYTGHMQRRILDLHAEALRAGHARWWSYVARVLEVQTGQRRNPGVPLAL